MATDKFNAAKLRAARSVAHLSDLLTGTQDFERLLDGYLETRLVLTRAFSEMAAELIETSTAAVETTNRQIRGRMMEMYPEIPDPYLVVRNFSRMHVLLLNYLMLHVGTPVSAGRLRVLSGEQVHTERRIRELRDLGYQIEAATVSGDQTYMLASATPDIERAAYGQVKRNITGADLDASRKQKLLDELGLLSA